MKVCVTCLDSEVMKIFGKLMSTMLQKNLTTEINAKESLFVVMNCCSKIDRILDTIISYTF